MAISGLTDYFYSVLGHLKSIFFRHHGCPNGRCSGSQRGYVVDVESAPHGHRYVGHQQAPCNDDSDVTSSESELVEEDADASENSCTLSSGRHRTPVLLASTSPSTSKQSPSEGGDAHSGSPADKEDVMEEIDLNKVDEEVRSEDPEEEEEDEADEYRERYRDEVITMETESSSESEDSDADTVDSLDLEKPGNRSSGFWSSINNRVFSIFSGSGSPSGDHFHSNVKYSDVHHNLV